jgi:ankyrin repeat protein
MIFNNVNYPNNLLQNAIERGDLSAVKRALIRGADVNATIRHFYNEKRTVSEYVEDSPTPAAGQLWLLADDRFYRIAADGTSTIALGSYIAKPAPRVETVVFKSPLTLAASLNALEIANFLYDNGAIVKDDSLRLAIQNNYVFMAQFLVARIPLGANWSLSPNAAQNADCLAIALTRGWSEIVGALCLAGVGVNGHNLDRKSSLEIAAARGDLSMVHFLCNQKEKCEHRFSACVEAAKLGHRDMVAFKIKVTGSPEFLLRYVGGIYPGGHCASLSQCGD